LGGTELETEASFYGSETSRDVFLLGFEMGRETDMVGKYRAYFGELELKDFL